MIAERATRTDADILAEIEHLPALADEGDAPWDDLKYWRDPAYRYIALSDLAAQRKLRPAVGLLLKRACNGDPGELMRGLRHAFEATFNPDWPALADVCVPLCEDERAGTRRWAIDQLMILDDARARPVFERALDDECAEIRALAAAGLERLDQRQLGSS